MKYKLTDETIVHNGRTLHRIECVERFCIHSINDIIFEGEKGGFVESEENLSQYCECWVAHDAKVYGNAKVYYDARVFADAEVYGNAQVYGNAEVFGNAKIHGDADVSCYTRVYGNAEVYGEAMLIDGAEVFGNAKVFDRVQVYHNGCVFGDAVVCGDAIISSNADVQSKDDYYEFKNCRFFNGNSFTWTRSNNRWADKTFNGTGEELIARARKVSEEAARYYGLFVDLVKKL